MNKTKDNNSLKQVSDKETEILLRLLNETICLDGDVVEFGCYKGETSILFEKIIEKYNHEKSLANELEFDDPKMPESGFKRLWLYDSFEGLPEKSREDASSAGIYFKAGELKVSKHDVVLKFKQHGLKVPIIKKAFFENLDEKKDIPEKICFGFLDGDLYGSIKTSLHQTFPRIARNGILVVHDYNNPELPGSSRAVDEFLRSHNLTMEKRETLAILKPMLS